MISYIHDGKSLILNVNDKISIIHKSNSKYNAIIQALNLNYNSDAINAILESDKEDCCNTKSYHRIGSIEIIDGKLYSNHLLIPNEDVQKYLQTLLINQLNPEPFMLFMNDIMGSIHNTYDIVSQVIGFIKNVGLTIDSKGNLIAYKAVTGEYRDKWTGKISNKIGNTVSMDRSLVTADPNLACAPGLHAGGLDYIKGYGTHGDKLIVVSISPSDIVCIPYDYSFNKMRVCKYRVLDDFRGVLKPTIYDSNKTVKEWVDEEKEQQSAKMVNTKNLISVKKKHTKRGPDGRFIK